MALPSGVGGCLLGRGPPCRRGAILDHMGREKVGCCGLSAITLHAVIMQPLAAASNLNSSLGSLLGADGRTQLKKQPRARMTKLGEKVPTRVACLPDGGLGGWGCPARLYSRDIVTASSCCQGAWGTLEGPTEPRCHGSLQRTILDKFDATTVIMFLFFQAKERSKRQGGSSWWSPRPRIIRPMELHVQNAMTG